MGRGAQRRSLRAIEIKMDGIDLMKNEGVCDFYSQQSVMRWTA
jgi:hypothetical protein